MRGKILLLFIYIIASSGLYFHQAYLIERSEFNALFFDISLLFMFYILIIDQFRMNERMNIVVLISVLGISFRMILLFYQPNLSDDFYRFLWDGTMLVKGENPYLLSPDQYNIGAELNKLEIVLYEKMNSPSYFTVYPPLNQLLFGLAVLLSPTSIMGQVIVLKIFVLLFELFTIIMLPRLLEAIHQPAFYSALYILNPLVIIETVGNLHFEGISVSILICFFYLLISEKKYWASIFLGLATGIKLLPLLLFPLILKKLTLKKGLGFLLISGLVFILFFIPIFSVGFIQNISNSLGLYFKTFEFNASIYYLIRSVGYWVVGYNIIGSSGWLLGLISALLIILYAVGIKVQSWNSFFAVAALSLFSHYLLSTTVHPWYIIHILIFAVLSGMYFTAICWSFLAFLSYQAYGTYGFSENGFLLAFEYIVVMSFLIIELRFNSSSGTLQRQSFGFDTK